MYNFLLIEVKMTRILMLRSCWKTMFACIFFVLFAFVTCNRSFCTEEGRFSECLCDRSDKSMICENQNFTINVMEDRKWFHDLPSYIEKLTFTGNQLTTLEKNMFVKKNHLKYLNLSSNSIQSVHVNAFNFLTHLTELILDNNDWDLLSHDLPIGLFNATPSLKSLSLKNAFNQTNMYKWPLDNMRNLSHVFEDSIHHLETLNLESNDFVVVSDRNMFCHMTQLVTLKLCYNFLRDLHFNISCTSITHLEVCNNSLPYLNHKVMNMFSNHSTLKQLDLEGNPFKCDCHMLPFRDWLNTTSIFIPDIHNFTCHANSPKRTHHKNIFEVQESDLKCKKEFFSDPMRSVFIVLGILIAIMCVMIGVVAYLNFNNKHCWPQFLSQVDYTEIGRRDSIA